MAKKSSKASTPSWRTLMRRAKDEAKAGKPKVAAILREQASNLRRGARKTSKPRSEIMKKAWATRRAKAMLAKFNPPSAQRGFSTVTGQDFESPGRGEIVGGAEYNLAEEITKLARKKGGKDAIQNRITNAIAIARAEGQELAERGRTELMRRQHEAHTDKVVCSAIGAFEQQMTLFNGLPPSVVMSSYTICRMLDALSRAGYTADGKK